MFPLCNVQDAAIVNDDVGLYKGGHVSKKLFAQRIAGRLGFKIILQHKHVSLEVALNIIFYLSSDDVVGFPNGGKGNAF
jgi:hypothetical protein